jgi:hypothetical protein
MGGQQGSHEGGGNFGGEQPQQLVTYSHNILQWKATLSCPGWWGGYVQHGHRNTPTKSYCDFQQMASDSPVTKYCYFMTSSILCLHSRIVSSVGVNHGLHIYRRLWECDMFTWNMCFSKWEHHTISTEAVTIYICTWTLLDDTCRAIYRGRGW